MILKKIFTIMSALVLFLISVRTGYSGSVSLSRSWVTRGDGSEIPTETRGTKLTAVTADKFDFKINYYMDRSGSMTNTPLINARVVASTFIDSIPYDTSYSVMVDSVQSGRWAVEVKNLTHSSYDVSGMAVGTPQIFAEDYELGLSTSRAGGSQFVAVGAKERLVLRIQKDGYDLTGVQKIEGVVRDVKGGKVADIVFQDDGDIMRGDAEASDGLYSALATFPAPGSYTIEVQLDLDGAKLRKTYVGLLDAPRLGDSSSEEGDFGEEIDATFSRLAILTIVADSSVEAQVQPFVLPSDPRMVKPSGKLSITPGEAVEFEATPFDSSNGNVYLRSDWIIVREYGRQEIISNDSNKLLYTFDGAEGYSCRVEYVYTNPSNPGEEFKTFSSDQVLINVGALNSKGGGGCDVGLGWRSRVLLLSAIKKRSLRA